MPAALKRADAVLALSEFTSSELLSHYPDVNSRIRVLSPGSHLPQLSSLAEKPARGRDAAFLFVGTMEPRKNLPRLVRAFARYVPDWN